MSLASDATAAALVVPVSATVLCVSVNGSSMLHEHTFDNLLISALFNPISPPRQLYSSTRAELSVQSSRSSHYTLIHLCFDNHGVRS
ncbi:hypothetical protein B0H14DRAFT_3523208 [Mycena olivaceomarginata]|nr:hypothetical protein B0H14DRAFT_3523208 [Mycena olivaceomarginata]